ncbi:hypothetical protein H696_04741 [Fonticula alba]|uniref:Uncharacterized protein n=1 Tax=Fonticula alba TaxID=691883 RepID=A0A058Z4L5_FONAL|nr:hypothetical protein H696_04741 [Fonticula alba]KCV68447.1 hypothetical protein H696_04741 [Fonticula alba]|eukprot:XP_009496879.1 hypothetical protein H696_04741 [Fonticula alba]
MSIWSWLLPEEKKADDPVAGLRSAPPSPPDANSGRRSAALAAAAASASAAASQTPSAGGGTLAGGSGAPVVPPDGGDFVSRAEYERLLHKVETFELQTKMLAVGLTVYMLVRLTRGRRNNISKQVMAERFVLVDKAQVGKMNALAELALDDSGKAVLRMRDGSIVLLDKEFKPSIIMEAAYTHRGPKPSSTEVASRLASIEGSPASVYFRQSGSPRTAYTEQGILSFARRIAPSLTSGQRTTTAAISGPGPEPSQTPGQTPGQTSTQTPTGDAAPPASPPPKQ